VHQFVWHEHSEKGKRVHSRICNLRVKMCQVAHHVAYRLADLLPHRVIDHETVRADHGRSNRIVRAGPARRWRSNRLPGRGGCVTFLCSCPFELSSGFRYRPPLDSTARDVPGSPRRQVAHRSRPNVRHGYGLPSPGDVSNMPTWLGRLLGLVAAQLHAGSSSRVPCSLASPPSSVRP
jgi:hypothetical protein